MSLSHAKCQGFPFCSSKLKLVMGLSLGRKLWVQIQEPPAFICIINIDVLMLWCSELRVCCFVIVYLVCHCQMSNIYLIEACQWHEAGSYSHRQRSLSWKESCSNIYRLQVHLSVCKCNCCSYLWIMQNIFNLQVNKTLY